ncbi:hypothetical protein C8R46DRAFT_1350448 [Mycena filopes]|nr:hypothetical protein C8R46DRAFT_1350448 [Mycena filopes]
MHPALQIQEIRELICDIVQGSYGSRRSSLAALARTSTLFQEPALNALWREMDSLIPLLLCLPQDVWELTPGDSEDPQRDFNLLRPICPEDLGQIWAHASRIKLIALHESDNYETLIRPDVADSLNVALCGRYLLPRLQKAVWRCGDFPYQHYSTFIGPATSISIVFYFPSISIPSLRTLATDVPMITNLSLGDWWPPEGELDSPEELLVARLHHLRVLTTPIFQSRTIHLLASLPDLESISLAINLPNDTGSNDVSPPHVPTFPSLRKLSLQSNTTRSPAYFINMLDDCRLVSLALKFNQHASAVAHTRLNTAIATHCVTSVLTTLSVEYADPVVAQILHPFCAFGNLQSLAITAPHFQLTDAQLGVLASSWPRLQSLYLTPLDSTDLAPTLTLESLQALAENCPNLTNLGIEIDARVVPATAATQHLKVKWLVVYSSPVATDFAVTRYIGEVLPQIEIIMSDAGNAAWARVIDFILWSRRMGRPLALGPLGIRGILATLVPTGQLATGASA